MTLGSRAALAVGRLTPSIAETFCGASINWSDLLRQMVRRPLGIAISLAGLVVAHRLINPAPLPAGGTLVGGLIAYAIGTSRARFIGSALLGCLVASAVHAYSHVTEGRATSALETAGHVATDAAVGFGLGALLLLAAVAVDPGALKPSGSGRAT